ncbi:MAG: Methylamine utilization protein MauE [Verrucomicrobia bacterium ADurb.Bin474]|nr:MAG: Methylamine utilization protein MauE [Verrucomicrobia bacterium ADurb.Bin474]
MIGINRLRRWMDPVLMLMLGGIFVYSGMIKLADPDALFKDILAYRIIGPELAYPMTFFLPAYELVCGVALLIPKLRHSALLWISLMLLVFMLAILSAWVRGIDVSCGCFGSIDDGVASYDPLAWIMRDAAMLVMAGWLWFWSRKP